MSRDATFAPRPRPDVAQARCGAGLLLYETSERRMHTLNTSAALIWRRMNGLTTLWDIAGSLAEVFSADRALIEGDVSAAVSRFDQLGLLAHDDDDRQPEPLPRRETDRDAEMRAQLDQRPWAVVSAVHQALGVTFLVRSEDPAVAGAILRVLRPLVTREVTAEHVYSVRYRVHEGAPQWRVYFDGTPLGTVDSADAATAHVLWHVNKAALEHTAGVLFFQAAAMQVGDRALLFPAPPGSGKSTLVTALARRGLSYLTDELAGLDLAVGKLLPYPKALALGSASQALFADLFPDAPSVHDSASRGRWHLDPASIPGATVGTGGRIALIVAPRYSPGAFTRLERLADDDALRLLLDNTFPFAAHGARGFQAVVAVAQSAPAYVLEYNDHEAACEVVLQLVRDLR